MTTTPHPGSAIAKAQEFAAAEAARLGAAAAVPVPEPPAMTAVPVTGTARVANADTAAYSTRVLSSTNPAVMVLPQDPQRYRAVVIASADTVYLCATREAAQEVAINGSVTAGALLPANVAVELFSKEQVWAANSSATTATITVIAERYEQLDP